MKETRTVEELLASIALLQAKIDEQEAEINLKNEEIQRKADELKLKEEEIQRKAEQILLLQRSLYGRRSEKRLPDYDEAVPNLFSILEGDEMLEEEKDILVTVIEEVNEEAKKRRETSKDDKKHITRTYRLPSDIRREDCLLEPADINLDELIKIGEDVTERLMYKPAEFWVKRIIRPIYKDKESKEAISTTIHQHPQLQNILPGCMADNTLLSQIIIDKYLYHLPENRQMERFKSIGVKLTPSTVNRWVHGVADKLYLLYKLHMEDVLSCDYIQVDESVQNIADRSGKSRKGYVWVVRSVMFMSVFYYYSNGSRSAEVLHKLLKDYQGALQSDGYAAYSIYESKSGVLPLGCLAHVRRKFENALVSTPEAQKALDYITLLYTIESNLKHREATFEEIRKEREEKSYPILQAMERWMVSEASKHTPKSLMSKAIQYAFGMLPRVSRYCADGRYEIDNNSVERAVRPLTLGRKNYLFSQNDKGAEDNAIFYTFITTCKELGIEPLEWFNHVLSQITDHTTEENLKKLLPRNYKNNKQ